MLLSAVRMQSSEEKLQAFQQKIEQQVELVEVRRVAQEATGADARAEAAKQAVRLAREQQEAMEQVATHRAEALVQQPNRLKKQQLKKQQPSKQQLSSQQFSRQQLSKQQRKHWLTSSNKHSTVGRNGSGSTSVEATTRCKAMKVMEVNLRRKEAPCVSFVRECRWNQ